MKGLFQQIKDAVTDEQPFHPQVSDVSERTIFMKWLLIGGLAFLSVLFIWLNVVFSPSDSVNDSSDLVIGEPIEIEEVVDDGPTFIFEETEDLPELSDGREFYLKEQIWTALLEQDYKAAADLAYSTVQSNTFEEESDFLNWYQDIYKVATVKNIPVAQQHEILSSFKVPRFQAVFPTFTSVLTLATIVEDEDSLLPIDVKRVEVMSEDLVDPESCKNVSPYIEQMAIHFKYIYKANIKFNDELVTTYVGVFNNGYLKLLGYYGENTSYQTDAYWESKRIDYAQNPNF